MTHDRPVGLVYFRFVILVLAFSCIPPASADETPQIKAGKISFLGGKSLAYKSYYRVHKKAIDAYRRSEPIYYREQVTLVKGWKRVIVSKYMNFFEGGRSQVTVYDYQGIQLNDPFHFRGQVLISENNERILLGQKDNYYILKKSFLLDKNGALLTTIEHSRASLFGLTDDGKLFWALLRTEAKKPSKQELLVINAAGKIVKKLDTNRDNSVRFDHNNINYEISLIDNTATPDSGRFDVATPTDRYFSG